MQGHLRVEAGANLAFAGRSARLEIEDGERSVLMFFDPVSRRRQREGGTAHPRHIKAVLALDLRVRRSGDKVQAGTAPGNVLAGHLAAGRDRAEDNFFGFARFAQFLLQQGNQGICRLFDACLLELFERCVNGRAARARIDGKVQRVKLVQPKDVLRIDGVRVALQRFDPGDRQAARAVFGRRGGARLGLEGERRWFAQGGQPEAWIILFSGGERIRSALFSKRAAGQRVQPPEPARRDSRGIFPPL